MGCLIPFLVALCALAAFGDEYDYSYDYTTDSPATDNETVSDQWLMDLLDTPEVCSIKPCTNGGTCEDLAEGGFKCSCREPFTGRTCQQVKGHCKEMTCGHGGSCVFIPSPPYYECKCNHPYRPPFCKRIPGPICTVNPCQNGGSCVRGGGQSNSNRRHPSFMCACPNGYSGKLCEVEPNDCYQGDGESYRGNVSVTVDGDECLNWNSYFVLAKTGDPTTVFVDFDGLGPHNFCRNPDGDSQPWCFAKKNRELEWKYCNIKQCPTDSVTAPTQTAPPTTLPPTTPSGTQEFSQCGKPEVAQTSRIFGGKKSFPGVIPWQVSVQVRHRHSASNFSHYCGGILLNSCWVLTAAHCINPQYEMQVLLGRVELDKPEDFDQSVPVERAIVHETYKETPFELYNDIAMLKLNVTDRSLCVRESRFVKSACLPDQSFPSGSECVISGWGRTEKKYHSKDLLSAHVLLISQEKCTAPHVYGDSIDDSMVCAGYLAGGVDTCQGDSGGPMVCERNGTHYVVGVVSWGDGCGRQNKPGVYANVLEFNAWINNHLNS